MGSESISLPDATFLHWGKIPITAKMTFTFGKNSKTSLLPVLLFQYKELHVFFLSYFALIPLENLRLLCVIKSLSNYSNLMNEQFPTCPQQLYSDLVITSLWVL